MRNQASHPHKETGKIIVIHICIFIFLDRKLRRKILDGMVVGIPEVSLLLISLKTQLPFTRIVQKYFNFVRLSKDVTKL